MKQQLIDIFELMRKIETKGDSTIYMADCLRALVGVINSMPTESEDNDG